MGTALLRVAMPVLLWGGIILLNRLSPWVLRRSRQPDLRADVGCYVTTVARGVITLNLYFVLLLAVYTAIGHLVYPAFTGPVVLALSGLSGLVVAMSGWAVVRPPGLFVRPEGVRVRGPYRSRTVWWTEIENDSDALYHAGVRGLPGRRQPRRFVFRAVDVSRLDVDPDRITEVLEFYRDHPEHRAAIGAVRPPGSRAPAPEPNGTFYRLN